jgi:carbonic anhydrase
VKKTCGIISLLLTSLLFMGGCNATEQSTPNVTPIQSKQISIPTYAREEIITNPNKAKQLLVEGNKRFGTGNFLNKDYSLTRRVELAQKGQHPFAVVVSCSDSRVPPEDIFDQALGDLFVIRVAGNVITPIELGSIEYAVEHLKVPFVLVLGHEKCGAVTAAVEGGEVAGSIGAIVDKIKPAITQAQNKTLSPKNLIKESTELNVLNALKDIKISPVIKHALGENLQLEGGMYYLETGEVQWIPSNTI